MRLRTAVLFIGLCGVAIAQTINYSYDAAGRLTGAAYPGGKALTYNFDSAGNLVRATVASVVPGATPSFVAAGVLSSASFASGPVAPGEIIVIFGANLGPASLLTENITPLGFFDNYIGNTSVLFDGVPAPIVYAAAGQTAVIVPYEVAGHMSTQLSIQLQGVTSAPVSIPVTAAAPGIFSANSSGTGNGAILNQDLSVNSASNPAARNSIVVIYGTGEGQTSPPGVDGRIASGIYPKPLLPVTVTIGGIKANVLYAGAAPSLVAGVFQVNAQIPGTVPSGAVPVVVTVGTASSQSALTVAVQ